MYERCGEPNRSWRIGPFAPQLFNKRFAVFNWQKTITESKSIILMGFLLASPGRAVLVDTTYI